MWIRQILVAVVGLASGFAVAAGLFSFIIGLGVVSDFADRTHTGKHVMLYENCIMAGGILGNIFWVYGLAMPGGKWIVPVFGLFFRNFCWLLVNGTCGNPEYFSDFYPEDQNFEMCAMADFWDGAWEKPWSTSVFL